MSFLRSEVRDLFRSKLRDGMSADEAADAIASLIHRADDRWDDIDISTLAERPGSHIIRQRTVVLEIPQESATLRVTPA